ncbi:Rieske (2Fe-2S) protein [Chachezhania sediminis]|uniref:Rieske (2Fe-2S) protein n=1 Tax=Chachezhania sediminis TaxID=2599291 RepID=UPI00131D160A|nr:Rieske 2Fe-2S domain-containing protein [Chachezhania sediminis]
MAWTDYRSTPPAGTFVCDSGAVTSAVVAVDVDSEKGSFPLILVRRPVGLRAYVNACPHQYLPLNYRGDQLLSACGTKLLCTAHGASFDADTGAVLAGAPCELDAVPVVEDAGQIRIGS